MAVTDKLAFFDLRDWWLSDDDVRAALVTPRLNLGKFADPFYPVSQQPEGDYPYARYTVSRTVNFPQWWIHTEQVGIDLYMMNIMDSTKVFNAFVDMASRGDESARDLHHWLQSQAEPTDFEYHSIEYVGGGDISPGNEEGGHHSRIMMFNINYSPRTGRDIA